jgi:hypothetical protein
MGSPGEQGPYEFAQGYKAQEGKFTEWLTNILGIDPNMENVPHNPYGSRPFYSGAPQTAGKLSHAASIPYIETQTHGGLPFDDVRAMIRKTMAQDPDLAAVSARMADTGRTSFTPWTDTPIGGMPPEWMRATPGESVNNVLRVPASELRRYGMLKAARPMPSCRLPVGLRFAIFR